MGGVCLSSPPPPCRESARGRLRPTGGQAHWQQRSASCLPSLSCLLRIRLIFHAASASATDVSSSVSVKRPRHWFERGSLPPCSAVPTTRQGSVRSSPACSRVEAGTSRAPREHMLFHSRVLLVALFILLSSPSPGQQSSPAPNPAQPAVRRILWIIPNHRTSPSLHPYKPLTPEEKCKIATEDSFDPGAIALATLFAGEAQLTHATPAFGQGVEGYARYLGTS